MEGTGLISRVVILWAVCFMGIETCPQQCSCANGLKVFRCRVTEALGSRAFPWDAEEIEITYQKTKPLINIQRDTFADLTALKLLKIKGVVGNIHPGAFRNLSHEKSNATTLSRLHLWSLSIYTIERGAFQDIRHFDAFKITSTRIGTIDKGAFKNVREIQEMDIWNVNITSVSSLAFQLSDIHTFTMKLVNMQHLSNGAFYGSKRFERIDLWKTGVACMGRQSFVGITKIASAEFSSSVLPSTPLLSNHNMACDSLKDFECLNASVRENVSMMVDASEVTCTRLAEDDWMFHLNIVNDGISHVRYTVGFVCGAIFFFVMLGLYMGNRSACSHHNKVWHHPHRNQGRAFGMPIGVVQLRATVRQPPAQRRRSDGPSASTPAYEEAPPPPIMPVTNQLVSTRHLPSASYSRIFYTSNTIAMPPSYEDCVKISAQQTVQDIPASPPPSYSANSSLGDMRY